MDYSEYKILDFPEVVRMLKYVFDKDSEENVRALQFTIYVYFTNLQSDLANVQPMLQLVKK